MARQESDPRLGVSPIEASSGQQEVHAPPAGVIEDLVTPDDGGQTITALQPGAPGAARAANDDRDGYDASGDASDTSGDVKPASGDVRPAGGHGSEQTRMRRRDTERLGAAATRDDVAEARDVAAEARDQAAVARNVAGAQLDDDAEDPRRASGRVPVRAAERRARVSEQRARAARERDVAAEDRRGAARDRADAASERLQALGDREALVGELQRERRSRDEALRHQFLAEKLALTLQRSLSPPKLPRVAGLDVAVHYEPAEDEGVGGDFYDLFPLAPSRSGFFLGDVCGKGPAAAAITSLARYTMRTAAMLHERPDAILMDLNAALRMENPDEIQTCTAVYGEIEMTAGAATITLAVAGHPPPLIVRANGSVETTPAHGTLLGAFDNPAFATCQIKLGEGDGIVVCSDGILDTKLNGVRVDEQRVAELLTGTPRATAQGLVDRLTRALAETDRPLRDDVAIMALRHRPAE